MLFITAMHVIYDLVFIVYHCRSHEHISEIKILQKSKFKEIIQLPL